MTRRARLVCWLALPALLFSSACPSHQPLHANVPAAAPSAQNNQGRLEVLSDTRGVDFGPYLTRALHDVRENWYRLIPEEAKAPTSKQGAVTLQFQIMKDGSLGGLKCTLCTSDDALDGAAIAAVRASSPFHPLPANFTGDFLEIRFRFLYNQYP